MPDPSTDELNRFSYFVNLARQNIVKKAAAIISPCLDNSLPLDFRLNFIHTIADQIAYHTVNNLAQTPHLDLQAYQQAYQNSIQNALEFVENNNNPFFSLTPFPVRQRLLEELKSLQQFQDPKKVQQVAQAAHQLKKTTPKITDSQQLAREILESEGNNYEVSEEQTTSLLQHLRNQKAVINNPTVSQIKQTIQSIVDQSEQLGFSQPVVNQFAKKLVQEKNLTKIHYYITNSVDSLPRQTPFTPWQPGVNSKTIQQAKNLNVSPLSLAYVKSGFLSTDPKLSTEIQQEIALIHQIINDPLNPRHRLNLKSHVTAAVLQPQVFIAQNYYHPVYNSFQQVQVKANEILDRPYSLYTTVNKKYRDFQTAYHNYIKQKPLGWLIAPRIRFSLAVNNLKLKTNLTVHHQVFKHQKVRRLVARTRLVRIKVKSFWGRWSPSGVKRRFVAWAGKKTAELAIKIGAKLGIEALKGIAAAALESSTLIGIPLAFLQISFSLAKFFFGLLKQKVQNQKFTQDVSGIAAHVLQTIIGALKALGAVVFGSIGGLVGSISFAIIGGIVGFALGGPAGAAIGAIAGFYGGGLLGTSLGALIGYSWMSIASGLVALTVGLTGFFSGLTGGGAAGLSGALAGTGIFTAIGSSLLNNALQSETLSSAFYLANPGSETNNIIIANPGSCFIPETETAILVCGSYDNSSAACRHGSNDYWLAQSQNCAWPIPYMDPANCAYSPHQGNVCQDPNLNNSCSHYGFAADFSSASLKANLPIYLPEINGEIVSWQLISSYDPVAGHGSGGFLKTIDSQNNTYEIYLTHLSDKITSGGLSGTQIGTLYDFGAAYSPHVHVELRINGEFIRPENFFCR